MTIIAITAEASTSGRERCLAAGMDAYIAKPFRSETLMDVIVEVDGFVMLPRDR